MVITPHALTGLLIATNIERLRFKNGYWKKRWKLLVLASILSFFSHFLMDAIPHHDYQIIPDLTNNIYKILIDMFFLFTISSIIYWRQLKITALALQTPIGRLNEPGIKINLRYLPLFLMLAVSVFTGLLPGIIILGAKYSPTTLLAYAARFHDFFHSQILTRNEFGIGTFIQIIFSLFVIFLLMDSIKKIEICCSGEEAEAWLAETHTLKY